MSAEQNVATARRWFDDICNGRSRSAAGEIFTSDHRHHDPSSPGVPDGPDGMTGLAAVYYTAFEDARWTVDDIVANGDTVAIRWTGSGTHTRELNGMPPTHRRVNVAGMIFFKFRNGKISESYDVWDTFGMMQQLGVVPQPSAQ
jgi:steroid delta-isomerase-like uncharacterized protein